MNQIELHKRIDEIIKTGPANASIDEVQKIINKNFDARQYFFTQVTELWLTWLWEKGILDVIKEKTETPNQISYRLPELNYIERVSEKEPEKVTDIMLAVPISNERLNPEVLDRFLRICMKLPAKQLKRLIPKMKRENWIKLLWPFDRSGFEYEKMIQILLDEKEYENILLLFEMILSIRSKKEIDKTRHNDNPFYLDNLGYAKVFKHIVNLKGFEEPALSIATKALSAIVKTGDKSTDGVFEYEDIFSLYDVDLFTLEMGQKEYLSERDNVRELVAVIKVLAQKIISSYGIDPFRVQELYKKYFESLPNSIYMWRFKLFILTLYPQYFKEELKHEFFRVFEYEKPWIFTNGAEYEQALQKGFHVLGEDKDKYIEQVVSHFGKKGDERYKMIGSDILSSILCELNEPQKQTAQLEGLKLKSEYKPEPSIGQIRGGVVIPKSPISMEKFSGLSIDDIAKNMRGEWDPANLAAKNTPDDFLSPLNAEGVGEMLRKDIGKRLPDYVKKANLFYERDVLDEHYTYSYFRGIHELFRVKNPDIAKTNWEMLFDVCKKIMKEGTEKPFESIPREREKFDAWLSSWTGVHSSIADVIQGLLGEYNGEMVVDFKTYRDDFLAIISCLLKFPDPTPEDEVKRQSDPFSTAINTVRGRAFQAFAIFVYADSKKFPKDIPTKIEKDTIYIYEEILTKEDTQALMFMLGHYLPSFYYRDIKWMRGLFPDIFSKKKEKLNLYLAAWEGCLVANLYPELFEELKDEYFRAIALDEAEYPKRKYFRELDEALATHIALAYVHFSNFGLTSDLFKAFWDKKNTKRHKAFISFIGRHCISRERADLWLQENKVDIEKIKNLWDWILEHSDDSEALSEFGFWMNAKNSAFDKDTTWLADRIVKTLEKTKGMVDWEIKLMDSMSTLADVAPKETLKILRLYFTGTTFKQRPGYFRTDIGTVELFKKLYKNPDENMQKEVYELINELLPIGNGMFWSLKEVIK